MGRACVDALRDLGEIVAVDVAEPQIDGVRGVACDVTDPDAVARLADLVGQAGPLRALVHAAGISPTMGDARRVIDEMRGKVTGRWGHGQPTERDAALERDELDELDPDDPDDPDELDGGSPDDADVDVTPLT